MTRTALGGLGRPLARAALAGALIVGLARCAEPPAPETPTFYRDLGRAGAVVDAMSAASMINGYRANHGLGAIAIDPVLMQVAANGAGALAAENNVRAALSRDARIRARLTQAGYAHASAAENVSAGYRTLAEAFSGWRDSKPHNAVLLDRSATRMGIATAYAPGSKYKVFWSLVMARPAE